MALCTLRKLQHELKLRDKSMLKNWQAETVKNGQNDLVSKPPYTTAKFSLKFGLTIKNSSALYNEVHEIILGNDNILATEKALNVGCISSQKESQISPLTL
jgi:hypothetical protein